jgi:hypothetical protein
MTGHQVNLFELWARVGRRTLVSPHPPFTGPAPACAARHPGRRYGSRVEPSGRRRWERLLLLFAAVVGVALMHSLAAPMPVGGEMATSERMAAQMTADATTDGTIIHSHGDPGDEHVPTPMSHQLGHLCVAILGAALLLALAVAVAWLTRRGSDSPRRSDVGTSPEWPRPPPRTAVRLAQLCVMRN